MRAAFQQNLQVLTHNPTEIKRRKKIVSERSLTDPLGIKDIG